MNENIIIIILCVIASLLVVIICNYNRCKYRFKYCQKKSKGITIDEMKIIIDNLDEIENKEKDHKKNNSDENELL
jgi:hypothetical protein